VRSVWLVLDPCSGAIAEQQCFTTAGKVVLGHHDASAAAGPAHKVGQHAADAEEVRSARLPAASSLHDHVHAQALSTLACLRQRLES
jgi:hypothetical protein